MEVVAPVRNDPEWRAALTPLTSIIGSRFRVSVPMMANAVGPCALPRQDPGRGGPWVLERSQRGHDGIRPVPRSLRLFVLITFAVVLLAAIVAMQAPMEDEMRLLKPGVWMPATLVFLFLALGAIWKARK